MLLLKADFDPTNTVILIGVLVVVFVILTKIIKIVPLNIGFY